MPEIWHISGICQLRISAEKVREKPESGLGIFREKIDSKTGKTKVARVETLVTL